MKTSENKVSAGWSLDHYSWDTGFFPLFFPLFSKSNEQLQPLCQLHPNRIKEDQIKDPRQTPRGRFGHSIPWHTHTHAPINTLCCQGGSIHLKPRHPSPTHLPVPMLHSKMEAEEEESISPTLPPLPSWEVLPFCCISKMTHKWFASFNHRHTFLGLRDSVHSTGGEINIRGNNSEHTQDPSLAINHQGLQTSNWLRYY